MAAGIAFEWDSRELSIFRGGQVEAALGRALRMGGNQAIRGLRKDATAHALARKALSAPTITEDQDLKLPKRSSAIRDFAWTLYVKGKPVPVAKFPHVDTRRLRTRRGVLVRFGQTGTQRLSGAFEATMRSGHVGVFRRMNDERLPIEELFSTRLPADYGDDVMITYGDKTYRKLQAAFTRGLDRELGKLKRKGDL